MFDDFGGALQTADLTDAGHVSAIPLHAEFEVLVRIETLCIDGKLSHAFSSRLLHFYLTGHLLDLDDHELGGLERCESDDDVDDAAIDIALRRGFFVALDEVGVARRRALECALSEQVVHERSDVEPNLRPKRLVVGFEDHPLQSAIKSLLYEQRRTADGNIFPFGANFVVAAQGARPPDYRPVNWEVANAIDGLADSGCRFHYRSMASGARPPGQARFGSCGCFPHSSFDIGPGI